MLLFISGSLLIVVFTLSMGGSRLFLMGKHKGGLVRDMGGQYARSTAIESAKRPSLNGTSGGVARQDVITESENIRHKLHYLLPTSLLIAE
jgi:hypothetical protein